MFPLHYIVKILHAQISGTRLIIRVHSFPLRPNA